MSYHFCVYQVLFQKINMYYKHWLDIALNGGKHWLQRTSTATTSMAPVSVLIYQNNLYNIRWPSKIKMHIDKFWWRCRYIYIYICTWFLLHGDCCLLVNKSDHHDQWVQWEFYWCLTCISDYRWDRLLVLILIDQCAADNRATERLD